MNLAELRRSVGLPQRVVAERMGVGQPRVSAIERAPVGTLTIAVLRSYLRALGSEGRITTELNGSSVRLS